jgi:predicted glycogen debranching enzyme
MRTVIAGYHWFTDWGRDTMISLEGLTLATGRRRKAEWILRAFAHYVRDGLIPNMFPRETARAVSHRRCDAMVLPRARALSRIPGDRATLMLILPNLQDIVRHHLEGTALASRSIRMTGY